MQLLHICKLTLLQQYSAIVEKIIATLHKWIIKSKVSDGNFWMDGLS